MRTDGAIQTLFDAAGGPDAFLERYAVILHADHGQTDVSQVARLEQPLKDFARDIVVTASNRAGQVYLLPNARADAAALAEKLDGEPCVDVSFRREGDVAVARVDGEEIRFGPNDSILDHPDAAHRAWAALANPNAGDLLVSAAAGWEFADLGGQHHSGGGSHGSLSAGDSLVPLVTVGIDSAPTRITEIAPAVLAHFGVEPPAYAQSLARVA